METFEINIGSAQMVEINRDRLLKRFTKYVKIDTAADPSSNQYPSSQGQWVLGKVLLDDLLEMGV